MTSTERVALVTWYLAFGLALSSREVAQITGLSRRNAARLLENISRVLPIYQDEKFLWRLCPSADTERHLYLLKSQ